MLGGIQPDAIRKLAADAVDDGLLQRICPIVLRPAVLGRDEPAPDINARYVSLVERLTLAGPPKQGGTGDLASSLPDVLQLEQGAQLIRRDLEERHLELMATETVNRKLAAHVGKYDGLFAGCASSGTASAERLPTLITEAVAHRVADFLHRFLLPHAVAFYAGTLGLSDDHDRLTAVAGYILAHKLEAVSGRDVQRGCRTMRAMDRHEIQKILEQLEAFGWLEQAPMPRNGTASRWTVSPAVHHLFEERGRRESERRQHARRIVTAMADRAGGG